MPKNGDGDSLVSDSLAHASASVSPEAYAATLAATEAHFTSMHQIGVSFLMAWYGLGTHLATVHRRWGDGVIDRLAADVHRDRSYLYRAMQATVCWPTEDDFRVQLDALRRPTLNRLYRLLPMTPDARIAFVEQQMFAVETQAEILKAETPELVEEVESIQSVVRQTQAYLHHHLMDGAMDDYTVWLRAETCIFCGATPCDVAHLPKSRGAGGMQVVPVCAWHHREAHQYGMLEFLRRHPECLEFLLERVGQLYVAYYSRRGLP